MPIITGKAYWAKLDRPAQKYKTTASTDTEWTIDITIDKKSKELINSLNPSACLLRIWYVPRASASILANIASASPPRKLVTIINKKNRDEGSAINQ